MKINVLDLLKNKITRKQLKLEINEKSFEDGGEEIQFLKPIYFDGSLRKIDEYIILNGKIETEILLTCSRCLEQFKHIINLEISEKLTDKLDDKGDDIIFIHNNELDLTDIIVSNLVLIIPIKKLCKEECKGLCPQCGTNLNYSQCDCKEETIDPRLSKLKDLFSND